MATLRDRANEIRKEIENNANTAERVGGLLEDILNQCPIMGLIDYNHGSGSQPYTSGELVLINDGTGQNTNKNYKPEGVNDIWDSIKNEFDFSELSLGDTVDIRLDMNVLTSSPNQTVDVVLRLAEGTPNAYDIPFIVDNDIKSVKNTRLVRFNGVYLGDSATKDNPAKFIFTSDDPATVTVNGWYVRIFKKSKLTLTT